MKDKHKHKHKELLLLVLASSFRKCTGEPERRKTREKCQLKHIKKYLVPLSDCKQRISFPLTATINALRLRRVLMLISHVTALALHVRTSL